MQRAAWSQQLKAALQNHRAQTEEQLDRLESVFEAIGKPARGKTCDAIEGIIAESEEIAKEFKGPPALVAGLISPAQAVEHYEITCYGTIKRWATELGMKNAAALFDKTLQEEARADALLTEIAKASANKRAVPK